MSEVLGRSDANLAHDVAAARQLPPGYTPQQWQRLALVAAAFRRGDRHSALALWRSFVGSTFATVADARLTPTRLYLLRIAALERLLASGSIGDDAQLSNFDLQDVLQKQQQILQMMATISKLLHDTALSVIRKLGD